MDGGSEFMADFEEACREAGIRLFVLPPRSPKLNGHVERAQETHTEEFWERYDGDLDLASARQALRHWECIYNTIRPHQSLAWRTPAEYLRECHPEAAPGSPSVSYVVNEDTTLTSAQDRPYTTGGVALWGRALIFDPDRRQGRSGATVAQAICNR